MLGAGAALFYLLNRLYGKSAIGGLFLSCYANDLAAGLALAAWLDLLFALAGLPCCCFLEANSSLSILLRLCLGNPGSAVEAKRRMRSVGLPCLPSQRIPLSAAVSYRCIRILFVEHTSYKLKSVLSVVFDKEDAFSLFPCLRSTTVLRHFRHQFTADDLQKAIQLSGLLLL